MKNDYEMYQSVLSRRNEHRLKKERRTRIIKRTFPVLACFIFTVLFRLGYWKHLDKTPIIPSDPDSIEVTTEAATSSVTGNVSTVTTNTAVTQTAQTHKNTVSTLSIAHSSATANTTYTKAQSYTQNTVQPIYTAVAARTQPTATVTQAVTKETAKQSVLTEIQTTAAQTSVTTKFGGFGGDDMAFHTLPQSGTTVSKTTLTTIMSVTTTTTNSNETDFPPLPMNEKFPIGIFDGDMTLYRNTYRISPYDVGDYIGIIGMRGQLSIYYAKAYKIKNIDQTTAIAVKFEEDEGYYLYRNNNTSIDTIKELISPVE